MVGVGLYCGKLFLRSIFFKRNFINLYTPFFGKAGSFYFESHIHVKALKMQGFSHNYMPYETLIKNNTPLKKGKPIESRLMSIEILLTLTILKIVEGGRKWRVIE